MEKIIRYEEAQTKQAARIADLIARGREGAYALEPGSVDYEMMVTEQRSEAGINLLSDMIAEPENFHMVAVAPRHGVVGAGIGYKARNFDRLEQLFVDERFQGQGIGRVLLERFGQWATRTQDVWVVSTNEAAQRFYRHHGFRAQWSTRYPEEREGSIMEYLQMKRGRKSAQQHREAA